MESKSKQVKLPFQSPKPEVTKTDLDVAVANALWTRDLQNYARDPEAEKRQRGWDKDFRKERKL